MRIARLIAGVALAGALAWPAAAPAADLYWLDTSFGAPTLNRSDPDGLGVTTLPLGAGTLPEGLAVDDGGLLYWAEARWSGARIMRTTTSFGSPFAVLDGGQAYRGVALDDVAGFVYWTVSNVALGTGSIHRMPVAGGPPATIVTLGPGSNPRGIAVDHAGGKIYWADFGRSEIGRANLDGTSPQVLVTLSPGTGPYGVAVYPGQHVYWTEYNLGQIRRSTLTGTSVVTLVGGAPNPTYIALDPSANRMYWAEAAMAGQKLRRANLNGSSAVTLPPVLMTYGGLAYSGGAPVPVADDVLPTEFAIDRLWPSPARGPVHISFSLPRESRARISVIDLQGREVALLSDGVRAAGRHQQVWNGRAANGRPAPAGVYFVRMAAGRGTWTRRLVIAG